MTDRIISHGIPISTSLQTTLTDEKLRSKNIPSKNRLLAISGLAVLIAIWISLIAKLLVYLIDFCTNISFFGKLSVSHANPVSHSLGIFVLIIPVLGGGLVGLLAVYGSKAIRGHGIPEAMEQVLTNKSRINPALTYLKPLSAAISIGTGGPFGAEGPIIATGGALGSTLGQLVKITHNERKILLAAGATAGMSAIFGSPIAAIFLAIELLLFEYSPRSIIPVSLACITGAAGHHFLFEQGPVFSMMPSSTPSNMALAGYSLLGVIIGTLAVFVTKSVYFIEDCFEKLPIHWMYWPALGGLLVGIIGYFAPRTLGVGYENITDILAGHLPLQLLLSLCLLKFTSWAVALGSGTSGGTLAPLLTIGAAAGALLGSVLMYYVPTAGITLPLAALVGMSALFAGASRALLTSIVFALETTGQANALLPLLAACTAAYFVSFFLMENTIMTEKIARRGVKTPHSYVPDLLEKITVAQVMNTHILQVGEDITLAEARERIDVRTDQKQPYLGVTRPDNSLLSLLSPTDIVTSRMAMDTPLKRLAEPVTTSLSSHQVLKDAVTHMANEQVNSLPVLSKSGHLMGVISYGEILAIYKQSADDHQPNKPTISLKRQRLKLALGGQKVASLLRKNKNHHR